MPDSSSQDVLDRVRSANPVQDVDALPGPSSLRGRQLLERLLATPPQAHRERKWRRWGPPTAVIVLLAGSAAAAAFIRAADVTTQVSCFEEATREADTVVVGAAGSPEEACEALWRDGTLGPSGGGDDVPTLARCTLPGGGLAVFPASSCAAVTEGDVAGAADSRPPARTLELQAVVDDMRAVATAEACVDPATAVAEWQQVLADSALDGWTIVADDGTDGCASLAVDEPARAFRLVVGAPPPRGDDGPPPGTAEGVVAEVRAELAAGCTSSVDLADRLLAGLADADLTSVEVVVVGDEVACADAVLDMETGDVRVVPRPG